ncbi:putative oxidoreductase [Nitrococcus mobilis Nb-231]|uniref:Putative oxidoreductase n=2 Tax=Nitrococcus mobilis TaxID=35797 RepID=A4BL74_9GAMM|nr:putative oxidoreductase [Nitrococcus mobilis Nb-231]
MWNAIEAYLPHTVVERLRKSSLEEEHTSIPEECMAALTDCGYFTLAIPKQFGGQGASIADVCAVQHELGYVFPSIAIATTMHIFTLGMIVEHWKRTRDLSWMLLQAITQQNSIVASAFAEPNLGGCLVRSNTKAAQVDDGYLLTGRKVPCSLIGRAQFACLHAQIDPQTLIVGLLPTASAGLSVQKGPEFMGMRASESDALVLDGCLLPTRLVMHKTSAGSDDSGIFKASLMWFCLSASAVYLGVARRALEYASQHVQQSTIPTNDGGTRYRSELPHLQTRFGEVYAKYLNLEATVSLFAQLLAKDDILDVSALPQALALKQNCCRELPGIVTALAELCGGVSYLTANPLNQSLRDILAIQYHPPTPLWVDRILGQAAMNGTLDFDFALDPTQQEISSGDL